jgi:hypothetical protein
MAAEETFLGITLLRDINRRQFTSYESHHQQRLADMRFQDRRMALRHAFTALIAFLQYNEGNT